MEDDEEELVKGKTQEEEMEMEENEEQEDLGYELLWGTYFK